MIALTIAGMVLTPIFISQGAALRRVNKDADTITRLYKAEQILYEIQQAALLKQSFPERKSFTKPVMNVQYKKTSPSKKSALSRYKGIKLHTLKWQWQSDRQQQKDLLVMLSYESDPLKEAS